MRTDWESHVGRWTAAGIIDETAATRIREWESGQARSGGLRWPILLALSFGALMLGAGVLLFVSAHWDQISAGQRMAVVVAMVAVFHAGGAAVAGRFEGLSQALHTIGTIALGAGIALAGQIFHLAEHWPAAVLLWAVGAFLAWLVLRHWTQAVLVAILAPYWIAGEWWARMVEIRLYYYAPIAAGVCALSLTYLSARRTAGDSPFRKALGWLGGIALLPAAFCTAVDWSRQEPPIGSLIAAWLVAGMVPLAVAGLLRRRDAVWNAIAVTWCLLLPVFSQGHRVNLAVYAWCAIGAIGLAWWGVHEGRAERINLGLVGFAITLLAFYFSSVMDKMGRSASLILLGLLFLAGGWLLEGTRRRLISSIRPEVTI